MQCRATFYKECHVWVLQPVPVINDLRSVQEITLINSCNVLRTFWKWD